MPGFEALRTELRLLRLALAAHRDALVVARGDPVAHAFLERRHAELRAEHEALLARCRQRVPVAGPAGAAVSRGSRLPAAAPTAPASADGSAWAPLSDREREVAILVARGLTNRQIGRALWVTEGTVANHIRRTLLKLGLGSRTQIAVWAMADAARRAAIETDGVGWVIAALAADDPDGPPAEPAETDVRAQTAGVADGGASWRPAVASGADGPRANATTNPGPATPSR